MKRLSDYKGEEAIELWVDLVDPLSEMLGDDELRNVVGQGSDKIKIAKTILKNHKAEAIKILTRIDPEPVDGLNIVLRLITLLGEIGQSEEIKAFFGFAEQVRTDEESSGSPMENTKGAEK